MNRRILGERWYWHRDLLHRDLIKQIIFYGRTETWNFDYVILSSGLHSSFRINKPLICTSCSIWYRHTGGNIIHLISKFSFIWSNSYFNVAVVLSKWFQTELNFVTKPASNIHTTQQHPQVPQLWLAETTFLDEKSSSVSHTSSRLYPSQGSFFFFFFGTANSVPEDNSFLINLWKSLNTFFQQLNWTRFEPSV